MRLVLALLAVLLLALPSSAATAYFRMGPGGPVASAPALPPPISIPDDAIELPIETGEIVDENMPPGMSHGFDPEGDCTPTCPCISRTWKNLGETFYRLYANNCRQEQISPTPWMQQWATEYWPAGSEIFPMHPA